MDDDHAPEPDNDPPDLDLDLDLEPAVEAIVEEEAESDSARHYLQDPNNLAENARDADEQEDDEVLDLDQTELEELGLTLDDPHQPESE
jgi:hypothetical protein